MNWHRPVEFVRVKRHPEGIYIDRCCADMVRFVDALPNTFTTWCCCGHQGKRGIVEFMSSMELDMPRREYADKGVTKGYVVEVTCNCGWLTRLRAKIHFKERGTR